jgi:hypothetical protein
MLEIGMKRRRVAFATAVVASSMLASTMLPPATASAETRGVVELFTSQGCSSCPPADKLAGELAHDPSLIVMSLAIDYWDYLGWKDTLALPGHTNRQRAYSKVRGDREVYTPQAVVNGVVHTLGSDKGAIENAVEQTRKQDGTLSLPLNMTVANDNISISIPAAANASPNGEIWLCPITRNVSVPIGKGENTGHTVIYHNVVRRWVKLGVWNGTATTWSIPVADFKSEGVDAVAVILQSGVASAPGPMVGAAFLSLDEAATAQSIKR